MIKSDYFDKGTDYSASDFTRPNYQLWVSKNFDKNPDEEQGLAPWVGQLVHQASYEHQEIGVIKEFSPVRYFNGKHIGGSIDRLVYIGDGLWQVEDIKTQGNYPAKKAFKDGKEEWVKQLSVYRWLCDDYDIAPIVLANIHQYVMGYQKDKKLEDYKEYNKLEIELMSLIDTELMIESKMDIAEGDEPIFKDCPVWMCKDYCSYNQSCPHYNKERKTC